MPPAPIRNPSASPIIVGAGLAGLAAAVRLTEAGTRPIILEASTSPGGRVQTDTINGLRIDRGFQVLLTAYPTASSFLDLKALDLRHFEPGAILAGKGKLRTLADPLRRPTLAAGALTADAARITDAPPLLNLALKARTGALLTEPAPDRTAYQDLCAFSLSDRVIDRFFRPFFGGVFLDRSLCTPASHLRFCLTMFAQGSAAIPALGMGAITDQLTSRLHANSLHCNTAATALNENTLTLSTDEQLQSPAIILAGGPELERKLLGESPTTPAWTATATLTFTLPRPDLREGYLILDSAGEGPINHAAITSDIAPDTAPNLPANHCVLSANIVDDEALALDDTQLIDNAIAQLARWFDLDPASFTHQATHRIPRALPSKPSTPLPPSIAQGLYRAGDWCNAPSIEGAITSGLAAADAALKAIAQ